MSPSGPTDLREPHEIRRSLDEDWLRIESCLGELSGACPPHQSDAMVVLSAAEAELSALACHARRRLNSLQPINRLSDEALLSVFLFYREGCGLRDLVQLAQTCWRWRIVLFGCPKYWRKLELPLFGFSEAIDCLVPRTSNVPLHLDIEMCILDDSEAQKHIALDDSDIVALAEVIKRNSARLRNLEILVRDSLKSSLSRILDISMPMLEELRLARPLEDDGDDDEDAHIKSGILGASLSNLQSLSLTHVSFHNWTNGPYNSLRQLSIRLSSPLAADVLQQMFPACPVLEELWIKRTAIASDGGCLRSWVLPHLRFLGLYGLDSVTATNIRARLQFNAIPKIQLVMTRSAMAFQGGSLFGRFDTISFVSVFGYPEAWTIVAADGMRSRSVACADHAVRAEFITRALALEFGLLRHATSLTVTPSMWPIVRQVLEELEPPPIVEFIIDLGSEPFNITAPTESSAAINFTWSAQRVQAEPLFTQLRFVKIRLPRSFSAEISPPISVDALLAILETLHHGDEQLEHVLLENLSAPGASTDSRIQHLTWKIVETRSNFSAAEDVLSIDRMIPGDTA